MAAFQPVYENEIQAALIHEGQHASDTPDIARVHEGRRGGEPRRRRLSGLHDSARLFHKPQALLAHWPPPFAERVEIHELNLLRNSPLLRARVEVFEPLTRRSPRWDASANAWQITLAFWSVSDLRLSDWTTTNCERLELTPSGPDLQVRFGAALSFRCSTVRVEGVSAYHTSELWLDGRPGAHLALRRPGPPGDRSRRAGPAP